MFNKKYEELQKKFESLQTEVSDLKGLVDEQEKHIKSFLEMFEDYESLSIEKALAKKSDEPWAGFSVSEVTRDGKVALKLDWNDQFIDHLKRNGINAGSDEDTVGVWFASLMKEMGEEIDEETANKIKNSHRIQ